jgi:hypothetical protein
MGDERLPGPGATLSAAGRDTGGNAPGLLVNTEILTDSSNAFPCAVSGLLLLAKSKPVSASGRRLRGCLSRKREGIHHDGTCRPSRALVRLGATGAGTDTREPGLVEQALDFVERNAGHEAIIIEGRG